MEIYLAIREIKNWTIKRPLNLYEFPTIFFLLVWENLKEIQKYGGDMGIYLTIGEMKVVLKPTIFQPLNVEKFRTGGRHGKLFDY